VLRRPSLYSDGMTNPADPTTVQFASDQSASVQPASDRITEQLDRLIPLVNGRRRVARVGSSHGSDGLPSLLSWDDDGQLKVD